METEIKTYSESEKRMLYKIAFGKEFDDINRKQPPLPIDLAVKIALHKIEKDLTLTKLNKAVKSGKKL